MKQQKLQRPSSNSGDSNDSNAMFDGVELHFRFSITRLSQYPQPIFNNVPPSLEATLTALKAKAESDKTPQNLGLLGQAHFLCSEPTEAEACFKEALQLNDHDTTSNRFYGQFLKWKSNYGNSCKYFKSAVDANPTDHNLRAEYGEVLTLSGQLEESTEMFRMVMEGENLSPETHALYGVHLQSIGVWEDADAQFQTALQKCSENPTPNFDVLCRYGDFCRLMHRFGESVDILTQALNIHPANLWCRCRLAHSMFLRGDRDTVLQQYQIMNQHVRTLDTIAVYGDMLRICGHVDEAFEVFTKIYEKNEDFLWVRSRRAYLIALKANGEEEIEAATDLVFDITAQVGERNKELFGWYKCDVTIWCSYCFHKLGDFMAMGTFQEAGSYDLKYYGVDYIIGTIQLKEKKYDDARKSFDKVLEMQYNHYGALTQKADALNQLEEKEEAQKCASMAAQLSPDSSLRMLGYGDALRFAGKFGEAEGIFQKILGNDPNNIDALSSLADMRCAQSSFEEAKEMFEKIMQLDPDHPHGAAIKLKLADTYRCLATPGKNIKELYEEAMQGVEAGEIDMGDIGYFHGAYSSILLEDMALEEASEKAKSAISTNPENIEALMVMIRIHYWQLKNELFAETAKKFMEIAPNDPRGYLLRAHGLSNISSSSPEINELIEKGSVLLDSTPIGRRLRSWCLAHCGMALANSGQNDQAAARFAQAMECGGDNHFEVLDLYGQFCAMTSDLDQAKSNFEKSINLEGRFYGSKYHYGSALAKGDDSDKRKGLLMLVEAMELIQQDKTLKDAGMKVETAHMTLDMALDDD